MDHKTVVSNHNSDCLRQPNALIHCPYCYYADPDSCEFRGDERGCGEWECGKCGRVFDVERMGDGCYRTCPL